jgi:deoxyribonuclease-4
MSVAGGLHNAFDHIRKVNGQALQIFTRNQRQWKAKPITPEEASLFEDAWKTWGDYPVASHTSYLINLAGPSEEVAEKSLQALSDELVRTATLKIPFLVMHPGSHLGTGLKKGISCLAENLDHCFRSTPMSKDVMLLLENTAGQGSSLGSTFEELAQIISRSAFPERLGICLDTCHAFAAGYDLATKKGYQETFARLDAILGLDRLLFFHLNDSTKSIASRVDRHEHIGKGKLGIEAFRLLMNDPRFENHPMVLETPKEADLHEDMENLALLRSL